MKNHQPNDGPQSEVKQNAYCSVVTLLLTRLDLDNSPRL